jgi:hypothetical protein
VANQFLLWDSTTLFFSTDMTSPGSAAPNMELPATMQLAPAEAATSIVEGPRPPSTWKRSHKLVSGNWKWLPSADSKQKTLQIWMFFYLNVKGWVLLSQRADLVYPDFKKVSRILLYQKYRMKNRTNWMEPQQMAVPYPSFLAWISDLQSQVQLSSQEPILQDFLLPPVKFLISLNKSIKLLTLLDAIKPRRQPGIKIWEKIPTLIETITKGIAYLWVHELTRGKTSSTGVPGLNDTPGCIPFDLMFWMSSCQLSVSSFSIRREKVKRINHLGCGLPLATSIWNVNPEAPAFPKAST